MGKRRKIVKYIKRKLDTKFFMCPVCGVKSLRIEKVGSSWKWRCSRCKQCKTLILPGKNKFPPWFEKIDVANALFDAVYLGDNNGKSFL